MARREGGALRQRITETKRAAALSLAAVTAMSPQRDPYRRDTPANHRDAEWVARLIEDHVRTPTIHPRGLHYVLVSLEPVKPDGTVYRNTEEDWTWLSGHALTGARWLGTVPFDRIADNRNEPPLVRMPAEPRQSIETDWSISLPDADDIEPRVRLANSDAVAARAQPYTIVLAGEKASLAPVIRPIADQVGASVFLPTGEMSDSMLWEMARLIEEWSRPAAIFYLSDFDPSGHAMPGNVARKLQALEDLGHISQPFSVYAPALTREQCEQAGLPSTPIKDTDRRRDAWLARWGREQTEIDALAALQPDTLARIVREAVRPFHDPTLPARVRQAARAWEKAETARLRERIGDDTMEALRATFVERLAAMTEEVADLRQATAIDTASLKGFALADFVPPDPTPPDAPPPVPPVLDANADWLTNTRRLVDRRRLAEEGCA